MLLTGISIERIGVFDRKKPNRNKSNLIETNHEGAAIRKYMRQNAEVIRRNISEVVLQSHREFVINVFMLQNMFSEDHVNVYLFHTGHDFMPNKSPQQTKERALKNRIDMHILCIVLLLV